MPDVRHIRKQWVSAAQCDVLPTPRTLVDTPRESDCPACIAEFDRTTKAWHEALAKTIRPLNPWTRGKKK